MSLSKFTPRTGSVRVHAALIAAWLAGLPFSAQADPVYDASVTNYYVVDHQTDSSPVSASGFGGTTAPPAPWNSNWQGSAYAGPGVQLGSSSYSSLNLIGWYYGVPIQASAAASVNLDDIIISGPNSSVSTSFNLSINGTQSATSVGLYPTNALEAVAWSTMDINYGGSFGSGSGSHSLYTNGIANGSVTTVTNTGMFDSSFNGTGHLTTTMVDVLTGVPLSLSVSLDTTAWTYAQFGAQPIDLEAISDYSHTLIFGSGLVFNLPDGYTVNSISGHIIDNHWVIPIAAVPEPETYAMLLAGLGLIGFTARRRKQNLVV